MSESDHKKGQRGEFGRPTRPGAFSGKRSASPHRSVSNGRPGTGYGKPAARGPYGKPANRQDAQGTNSPERRFARPLPRQDGQVPNPSERKYGRPAPGQHRQENNPAERRYGRPAPQPVGQAAPQPSRQEGKPGGAQPDSRRFTRPGAPSRPFQRRDEGFAAKAPFRRESTQEQIRGPYGRPAPDSVSKDAPAGGPSFSERPPFRPARPSGYPGPRPGFRQSGDNLRPVPSRPAQPALTLDARKAALLVLNRVLIDEGYASLSLDEMFQKSGLSPRDKRLTSAIVYKTLEDLVRLDFALDQFLSDRSALDLRVINILRLSACQILLMDKVPDFASVNEAVELTRQLGMGDMTGLVNGVLRSLIRAMGTLPWPKPGDENYLSVTHSIPQWLAEEILNGYPEETAMGIISYRNQEHAVTLRRNGSLLTQAEFEALLNKKVWNVKSGRLPGVVRVSGVSDIARDQDFLGGRFSIQGEGSMMAALALKPGVGAQVLDCCAAPGGKTCYLAEMMQNTGRIYAWDLHEHRVELIRAQAERLRLYNIRPAVRDSSQFMERLEGMMDAVLLDAPCSGTGVMDNKPDIKYRLTPESLASLVALQELLLDVNSRYVKPGGVMVYATCSVLPKENERQIERFLKTHPEFALDLLPDTIPSDMRGLVGAHGLQLLPFRDGMEGFFIACMRRS